MITFPHHSLHISPGSENETTEMPSIPLENHAPGQSSPRSSLTGAERLVLIDNYDSFTWNLYEYLCREGATVNVYRNDQISLKELTSLNPTQLVISPGPGEPDIAGDTGISRDAIEYFAGKIPIFGVCMGEQCVFSVFGGQVLTTGEWHHGKTSPLKHDGKGVYKGIDQDIPVTRYHSLAGTQTSLPAELEVSSWVKSAFGDGKDIIMGIRHRKFVIEGVQFHPESITTAQGLLMCRNFLEMRGGTWEESSVETSNELSGTATSSVLGENNHLNQAVSALDGTLPEKRSPGGAAVNGDRNIQVDADDKSTSQPPSKPESILDKIFRHRRIAVEQQKQQPFSTPAIYHKYLELGLAPPQISFPDRLRTSPYNLSLMAEIKRASPSKGSIADGACAPLQAREYALAGASVISVLTEPEWFKGSIDDLKAVRKVLEGMRNRPAILRKEFIFDEYQILEARISGADTVLLIVKMLSSNRLAELYRYSKTLGMEALVEVNTAAEMQAALSLGAKVIGVNNRNLENFNVDLDTTTRLMQDIPSDTIVCALSGINGSQDVQAYRKAGVGAVLVGEALMRAPNPKAFVQELLGGSNPVSKVLDGATLVKICGTRDPVTAKAAIEAGADMVGIILVEGRRRTISHSTALEISHTVHQTPKPSSSTVEQLFPRQDSTEALEYFDHQVNSLNHPSRALLVGVFQNQSLSYILQAQKSFNLDVIQLHGSEPIEWASQIPVPVIRRFDPSEGANMRTRGYHALPMLDSSIGGTGEKIDLRNLRGDRGEGRGKGDGDLRFILAGGLDSENVAESVQDARAKGLVAVDVCSGVESDGKQDVRKIQQFIRNAKAA